MAADGDALSTTITDVSTRCLGSFHAATLRAAGSPCSDVITAQHRSFRVWIAYTGALSRAKASLDARLRHHDHMKVAVLELLALVEDCLECGESHMKTPNDRFRLTGQNHALSEI